MRKLNGQGPLAPLTPLTPLTRWAGSAAGSRGSWVLVLVLVLTSGLEAQASCDDEGLDPDSGRRSFVCRDETLDGFAAPLPEIDLTVEAGATLSTPAGPTLLLEGADRVTVEAGAEIRNAPGEVAIQLDGDTSSLTLQDDEMDPVAIQVTGAGAVGVSMGNNGRLTTHGSIDVDGSQGIGLRAGDRMIVVQESSIDLMSSEGAIGVDLGDQVSLIDRGVIAGDGADAIGLRVGDNAGDRPDRLPGLRHSGEILLGGAGAVGILVGDNAEDVSLAGTIRLTGDSAVGVSTGTDTESLTHSGILEIDGDMGLGLRVGDNAGDVTHTGSLVLLGDGSIGIQAGADVGLVTHAGVLELDGASSVGVELGRASRAVNESELLLRGDGSVGLRLDANAFVSNEGVVLLEGAGAIGIDGGDTNQIRNGLPGEVETHRISVTGADGVGVRLGDGNGLVNEGTIEATGMNGIAVVLGFGGGPVVNNDLVNVGVIRGGAGTGTALLVEDVAGGDVISLLQNRGTIEVVDALGERLADVTVVQGGSGRESFRNAGTIWGHVDLGSGDDVFVAETGGTVIADPDSMLEGEIRGGAGTDVFRLGGVGSDRFDFARPQGFERFEVEGGTWTLRGTSSFAEGVHVAGGSLRVEEPITISNGLTFGPDGVLEFGGADARVDVLDAVLIEAGATLRVVSDGELGVAGNATLLSAPSIDGSFELAPAAGLALERVDLGASVELVLARAPFADSVTRATERAVANYLDGALEVGGEPTGDFGDLIASLNALSPEAFAMAAGTLHPEAYDAHTSASLAVGRLVTQAALRPRPRCEEVPYRYQPSVAQRAPCGEKGIHIWAEAVGELARRDGSGSHLDYDRNVGGLVIGGDLALLEHVMVTGFVAGTYADLDVDGVGSGSAGGVEIGVGGVVDHGGSQLRGALSYGHGFHEQERRVVIGGSQLDADGDFGSDRFLATLEAVHLFRFDVFELGPAAGIDYAHVAEESFDESGAQAASLAVDERSNDVVNAHVGLRAGATLFKHRYITSWLEWANGVWRPEIHARWRTTLTGSDRDLEARLRSAPAGSGSFDVDAEDAKSGVEVGLGTSFQPYGYGVHLDVGVDAFLGDGNTEGRAHAQVRVPF